MAYLQKNYIKCILMSKLNFSANSILLIIFFSNMFNNMFLILNAYLVNFIKM